MYLREKKISDLTQKTLVMLKKKNTARKTKEHTFVMSATCQDDEYIKV
jgi:hypothetical protein